MRASWLVPRVVRAHDQLINTRQREVCSEAPSPLLIDWHNSRQESGQYWIVASLVRTPATIFGANVIRKIMYNIII